MTALLSWHVKIFIGIHFAWIWVIIIQNLGYSNLKCLQWDTSEENANKNCTIGIKYLIKLTTIGLLVSFNFSIYINTHGTLRIQLMHVLWYVNLGRELLNFVLVHVTVLASWHTSPVKWNKHFLTVQNGDGSVNVYSWNLCGGYIVLINQRWNENIKGCDDIS